MNHQFESYTINYFSTCSIAAKLSEISLLLEKRGSTAPVEKQTEFNAQIFGKLIRGDVSVAKVSNIENIVDWQGQRAIHLAVLTGNYRLVLGLLLGHGVEQLFLEDRLCFIFSVPVDFPKSSDFRYGKIPEDRLIKLGKDKVHMETTIKFAKNVSDVINEALRTDPGRTSEEAKATKEV